MHTQIAVVGGGLAGLAAAQICARAGCQVRVFERGSALGGRSSTAEHGGYFFNQGLRALYRGGPAETLLRELDVPIRGTQPPTAGALLWDRGALHSMPIGFVTLASTGALPARSKLAAARFLFMLDRGDIDRDIPDLSLADFIAAVGDPALRRLLYAIFRLATYSRNASQIPARAAVRQLRRGARDGVLYLDHGWQHLVDGLAWGLNVSNNAHVTRVEDGVLKLEGEQVTFDACILAVPPATAARLVGADPNPTDATLASCLDIAVRQLPNPKHRFVIGLNDDETFFFNVQSQICELAPPGGALISVIEYLLPDARGERATLERIVDALQPGWRDHVVHTQFLPKMTVAAGKARSPHLGPRIFGAGDGWGEDMLVDGALGSARAAATLAIDASHGRREAKVA